MVSRCRIFAEEAISSRMHEVRLQLHESLLCYMSRIVLFAHAAIRPTVLSVSPHGSLVVELNTAADQPWIVRVVEKG